MSQQPKLIVQEAGKSTPAELDDLRSLYTALKEGRTTWAEVMSPEDDKPEKPEPPKAATLDAAADKLEAKAAAATGPQVQDHAASDDLAKEPAFLRAQSRAKGGR
jgi:hypothetical protein